MSKTITLKPGEALVLVLESDNPLLQRVLFLKADIRESGTFDPVSGKRILFSRILVSELKQGEEADLFLFLEKNRGLP